MKGARVVTGGMYTGGLVGGVVTNVGGGVYLVVDGGGGGLVGGAVTGGNGTLGFG